jgi:glyoxylase-like metal-dependent hydrolase (beta-lactamase superfamily II)
MERRVRLLWALAAISLVSAGLRAQDPSYPITLVPPGKGPYAFPQGYQTPWDKIEMPVTEKLAPNLYLLHGSSGLDPTHPDAAGGRVAVLFGPEGVLVVDTEDPQLALKTLDTIRTFTKAPIKVVVNSHIHPDHTGGNAFFARQGAVIFAQGNLREEMLRAVRPPDPAGVPAATYQYSSPGTPAVTIHMNGETVDFIPMMPSHTAGDTIVRFNKANAIYIEDFYRNYGYPFADQANGGSIRGMIEAVDLIEKIAAPDTILVPGHGTLVTKKDLVGYRAMIVDILARVEQLRNQGKSLDEVLAANLTAPYDKTTMGDTKESKDRFIAEVYNELKDFPPVVNGVRNMRRNGAGR